MCGGSIDRGASLDPGVNGSLSSPLGFAGMGEVECTGFLWCYAEIEQSSKSFLS